jgi:predicted dehydrogenase
MQDDLNPSPLDLTSAGRGRAPERSGGTLDRRRFLAIGGALVASALLPSGCASDPTPAGVTRRRTTSARIARGERLRIGVVGVSNQGGSNLDAVSGESIVALCDVDANALGQAGSRFADARRYRDYRELLADDALDLDGVVISTPDHTHAAAAAIALTKGLGVYLEKPLTHTVEECRLLESLAARHGSITQMGTVIHASENYRRVVELVRSGAIGRITQVDTWCPKSWCCGKLTPGAQPPAHLDWTLWQGPVAEAEYVEGITPANWRGHWRYGTGTLGDMGCHILDLPFWALGLDDPRWSRCEIHAEGPPLDAIGCPPWLEVSWAFPQPGADPLILRWFDGGRIPPLVQELGAKDRQDYFGRFMVCFQGTRGFLMANYGELLLLQAGEVSTPAPSFAPSPGQQAEWLRAMREGAVQGDRAPLSAFGYAAPLTELVLSGTIAYRAGRPIVWDRRRPIGLMEADIRSLAASPRRQGWALPRLA